MDNNKQILRINGDLRAKNKAQEEKHLKELEKIINSGTATNGKKHKKEYAVEDLLKVFELIRHITVEVLCCPIHLEENLTEENVNSSFVLKDPIRLMKIQYQNGNIFYPVFTNDEAPKAAIDYGTNVTMKMSGEEFTNKMKSLAPAFVDGSVTGIAINPNIANQSLFIPGELFLYSLNTKEEIIEGGMNLSISLSLNTGEDITKSQKTLINAAVEFFKKNGLVESAYIAFMQKGDDKAISILIYVNAKIPEPRIFLNNLHGQLIKRKPSYRIDYMINNEEIENMFKDAGIGPFYKK